MAMTSFWLVLLIGTAVLFSSCQSAKQDPDIVVYEPGSVALEQLYQEARAAYLAESFGTAAEMFAKVVAVDPQHLKALVNWGAALSRGSRPQEALPKFERALAMDPNNAAALYNMGVALERLGRHDIALTYYHRAVALDSTILTPALQQYIQTQETRQQEATDGAPERRRPDTPNGTNR